MCPHGLNSRPKSCSQCLGIPAKVIEVRDGVLLVDGINRGSLSEINRTKLHDDRQKTLPNAKKTCSICMMKGHNSRTCPKRDNLQEYDSDSSYE